MQLNAGESSYMIYFTSEEEALHVVTALKAQGIQDIQLSYVSESPQLISSIGYQNLSAKILGKGHYDNSYGPLLAADPSVSGMSGQAEANLISSYLVTVVADRIDSDKIQQILNK